jgi:hypothetical protein
VLHLSTRWDFTSIRKLALNNIQPRTPHDRLLLARSVSVDHWVDIEDMVLVATVRENIRTHVLQVDASEIPHRVEAAQTEKPVHVDSFGVSPAVPTSEAF